MTSTIDWVDPVARAGYGAKGVVYAVVGLLALQAAWGAGQADGSEQAIREIGAQPFGQVLLVITALGLACYVVWRFIEAILDPSDEGHDAMGLAKRVGYAISGMTYASLAFLAAQIVFVGGSSGEGGGAKQTVTAKVLALPFGVWLVGIAGVIVVGVGVHHFYRVYKASFMKHYKSDAISARQRRWAKHIGRFGLSARGVTFVIIGIFVIQAARQAQAGEVRGLGGTLQTLAAQPYGAWLLGFVAAGFIAYGIYCFSRARYRHFETP